MSCTCVFSLGALPQGENAVSGRVNFSNPGPHELAITASDRSIVNYQAFDVAAHETVRFIQPNASSTVLNRILGGNPSFIDGSIQANGRVFLVNSRGIVFGKTAIINTGSLVASTLNISDDDFINDRLHFVQESDTESIGITNYGTLCSAPEGAIVLLSPRIRNEGLIHAKAGKVILAGAEMVSLDFSGEGISFALEGEAKDTYIEQLGILDAPKGDVYIGLATAAKAISSVVNMDDATASNKIIKSNGVVRLTKASRTEGGSIAIQSNSVEIEGCSLIAERSLEVTGHEMVHLRDSADAPLVMHAGTDFKVKSEKIDVLVLANPETSIASGRSMAFVSDNAMSVDAHLSSGGDFALQKSDGSPGDFVSLYDPIISATGSVSFGAYTGVALKVESTGRITSTGAISITGPDLTAPLTDTDGATMQASAALILRSGLAVLQGFGLPVPPNQVAGGATFTASGAGTDILLSGATITTAAGGPVILANNVLLGANTTITTSGGNVTITGTLNSSGLARTFNTNAGTGIISISGATGTVLALSSLTLSGSSISIGDIGAGAAGVTGATTLTSTGATTFTGTNYLANAQAYTAATTFNINSTTSFISSADAITFTTGTIALGAGTNLSINSANGAITTGAISGIAGQTITMNGGTGAVTVGNIGTALGQFTTTSLTGGNLLIRGNIFSDTLTLTPGVASTIFLGGNISTNNTAVTFPRPVTRDTVASSTINTGGTGANITFSNTLNGDVIGRNLTLQAGTGTVLFSNSIGATIRLAALTATGNVIQADNIVQTSNAITFTAPTINLANNLSSNVSGNITLTGNVIRTINNAAIFSTAAAGNISITGTLDGDIAGRNLTVTAGAGGIVTFGGAVGTTVPLTTFTVTGSPINQNSTVNNTGVITYSGTANIGGNITTADNNIVFNNNIVTTIPSVTISTGAVGAGNITITGTSNGNAPGNDLSLIAGTGTVTFTGLVGNTQPFNILSASGSTVTQTAALVNTGSVTFNATTNATIGSTITTSGAVVSLSNNVLLGSNSTINTSGGGVTISGTLNSSGAARTFNVNAGAGIISIGGVTGTVLALSSLTLSGSTINIADIGAAAAGVTGNTTLTSTGAINFTGTNYRANIQAYTATTTFNINTGTTTSFISSADAITFTTGTIALGAATNLSINSANGAITTGAITGIAGQTITMNGGTGAVTVGNIGTALGQFTTTSLTGGNLLIRGNIFTDTLTLTPGAASTIFLGGNISTNNTAVTFPRPVTRDTVSSATVNTGTTGANITFSSTLNGDVAGRDLILQAGTGTVLFSNSIGATVRLANLTATGNLINATNIVQTANAITFTAPTIQLASTVSSNVSGNILLDGNVVRTINAAATFSTAAAGNISITGTLNGDVAGRSLTLNAGAGIVTLGGAVGATVPLTTFTVTGGTINQNSTVINTGVVTYTGNANIGGNITTTNSDILFNNNVTTTIPSVTISSSAGAGNITVTGMLNGNAPGHDITFIGGTGSVTFSNLVGNIQPFNTFTASGSTVSQNAAIVNSGDITYTATTTNIGANITTNGSVMINGNDVRTLVNPVTINTSGGNGNITITGTTNGNAAGRDFTFLAGTGNVSLGAIGNTTRLANLTINGGVITFNGVVQTTAAINVTGTTINVSNNVNTNTASAINFNGDIVRTVNNAVTISSTGGPINFNGMIDGDVAGRNLTVTAGAGTVMFNDAVGSIQPLMTVAVTAGLIDQNASVSTTGTVTYTGATNLGGNITTANANILFSTTVTRDNVNNVTLDTGPGPGNITFTGTLNGDVAGRNLTLIAGTGTITFSNMVGNLVPLNNLSASGALIDQNNTIQTAGTITFTGITNLGANITTADATITFNGNVVRDTNNALTVTTGPGAGDIIFNGTINGSGATRDLTLDAGTGNVAFNGSIGNSTALRTLVVTGTTIDQNSTVNTSGTITYNGTTNLGGNITTSSDVVTFNGNVIRDNINAVAVNTGNGNIIFNNLIDADTTGRSLTLTAGTADIFFNGAVGSIQPLNDLIATASDIFQNSSVQTDGIVTYTGITNLGGDITTQNSNVTFTGAVIRTLINNVTVSTGSGPGNIFLSSTLNGDVAGRNLTLNAGTGNVTFGAVGNTVPLNNLIVTGTLIDQNSTVVVDGILTYNGDTNLANNVTANSTVTFNGNVIRDTNNNVTVNTSAGGGDIIFTGTINGNVVNRNLTLNAGTGNVVLQGGIGNIVPLNTLLVTGTTITQNGPVTTTDTVTYNGITNLGGDITTSSDVVTFNGNVVRNNTNAVTVNTVNANIIFNGLIDADTTGRSLTLTAGTGDIFFNGAVGSIQPLNDLIATATNIFQTSSVQTTGIVTYTGMTSLGGNITTQSSDVTFVGTVVRTLINNLTVSTGPGPGNIFFSSTINGDVAGRNLTLNAGTGNVTFTGAVGNTVPLNNLIVTGGLIDQNSTIVVDGILTFNGNSNLSNDVTANSATFNGNVIRDTNNNVTVNTSAGGGDIIFTGTINGDVVNRNLTLNAGTGNVLMQGGIGNTVPLNTLLVTATIITQNGPVSTTDTITYNGITNLGGDITTDNAIVLFNGNVVRTNTNNVNIFTGVTGADVTFTGTLNADVAGRNLTIFAGTAGIFFNGAVGDLVPLGKLTATAATIDQNSTVNASGVNYTGLINIGGDITTTLCAIFNGNVLVDNPGTQTILGGKIVFNGTLNANVAGKNLVLSAPSKSIIFSGAVGDIQPWGDVQILDAGDVTVNSFKAASFSQFSGSGTTLINGTLSLDNAINIKTYEILLNGVVIASALNMEAETSILSLSPNTLMIISSDAYFNALTGTVGTRNSPIGIEVQGLTYAGSPTLGVFSGSTGGDDIFPIATNPPCIIILNGLDVHNCGFSIKLFPPFIDLSLPQYYVFDWVDDWMFCPFYSPIYHCDDCDDCETGMF